jgi:nitrogen fixation protein FixH
MNAVANRGRWIPWTYAGGMLVVIAVNAVLITAAFRSFPGLVVQRPYDRGIAYNDQLRQSRAQTELGWTIVPRYDARRLSVRILDASGNPVPALEVRADLSRPLEAGSTVAVALASSAEGYVSDVVPLRPGQWDIALDVTKAGDTYRSLYRIVAP